MNKEVPVTYEGVMVGVAELTPSTDKDVAIINVRLNHDSVFRPFFVDHTMTSISISEDALIAVENDEFDLNRLCDDCDLKYAHAGPCMPYFTHGLY